VITELPADFKAIFAGPTSCSNWLIPNAILMSAYPGDLDDAKAKHKAQQYVQAGITTYVCLQTPNELKRFLPYRETIEAYQKVQQAATAKLEFLNFPIADNGVAKDDAVDAFTDELVQRYHNGEKILIHWYVLCCLFVFVVFSLARHCKHQKQL